MKRPLADVGVAADHAIEVTRPMPAETPKVRSLVAEIEALSEAERQELAHEVLPLLLSTRAGLEELDHSLAAFSDEELDAIIERARHRASALSEDEIAAIIAEGIRAVRAQRRSS